MGRLARLAIFSLSLANATTFATAARAGGREEAVLSLMEQLRSEEWAAKDNRVVGLHDSYFDESDTRQRRMVSLALGVNYLESSPKLALQYLSSAELDDLFDARKQLGCVDVFIDRVIAQHSSRR